MATFRERLYTLYDEARQEKGVGRKVFAARCDVRKGQLDGWLDGAGAPSIEDLKKIAKNLNVSLSWLMGASEIRAPHDELVTICADLSAAQVAFLTSFAKFLKRENHMQKM